MGGANGGVPTPSVSSCSLTTPYISTDNSLKPRAHVTTVRDVARSILTQVCSEAALHVPYRSRVQMYYAHHRAGDERYTVNTANAATNTASL